MEGHRKGHPDEKGTESNGLRQITEENYAIARAIPMKRELKARQTISAILPDVDRKGHPDEKGTES